MTDNIVWTGTQSVEFDDPGFPTDNMEALDIARSQLLHDVPNEIEDWHHNNSLPINPQVEIKDYEEDGTHQIYTMKTGYSFEQKIHAIKFKLEIDT